MVGKSNQTFKEYYSGGETVTLNEPTKDGAIFIGWRIISGNGSINNNVLSFNNSDVIINASWTELASKSLMLRYDAGNNSGSGHNSNATTWTDLSGNGNNAKITGATWGDNYLLFDGTDDYAAIKALNYSNYTVEVVTAPANVANSGQMVIIANWETGGYGLNLNANGIFSSQAYISSVYYNAKYSVKATANTVYHVAGSFDGSKLKLYINGTLTTTTNISGSIGSPSNNTIMMIGTNPNGSAAAGSYYAGKIYSVRIYNRALSASEITTNYNVDKVKYNLQ